MELKKLKSGTDIRGVASDICGKEVNLTDEAVFSLVSGFADWLAKRYGKKTEDLCIAVGHDSRISAERIKSASIKALTNKGVRVLDCGLASTPAMFMITVDTEADGSVQITASHHPSDRNGLKFFSKDSGIESRDLDEIITAAENQNENSDKMGEVVKTDYMPVYAKGLRRMICERLKKDESDLPLKNFHIVVDAGNGVGGFYANEVLKPLGADISGSRYLDPDGMFPNHIPNPENAEAMESICEAVTESKADLGIIFDTDVDRAGCVDSNGNEINRNSLIALASIIALDGHDGGTIVTDSVTSDGLKTFINEKLGGVHYRYKRGYRNVIDKAIELCNDGIDCPLAIETSGHAAFKENYFLDDGAYLVTRIVSLIASGFDISEQLSELKIPAEAKEIRFDILQENFRDYGNMVLQKLSEFVENTPELQMADDNREGIRASMNGSWFLLRLSVHDPIMPLNVESDHQGGCDEIMALLKPFLKSMESLDTSKLS